MELFCVFSIHLPGVVLNIVQGQLNIKALCCVTATDWVLASLRPLEVMCLSTNIPLFWFPVKHEELCQALYLK